MKKLLILLISTFGLVSISLAYTMTPADIAIADRLEQKVEEMLATKPVEQRERIIGALNFLSQSPQFSPQMQTLCLDLSNRFYQNAVTNNIAINGSYNQVYVNNVNQQDSNNTTITNNYYTQYNSNDDNSTNVVVSDG